MNKVLFGCIIAVFIKYSTSYPADDPISKMLSDMSDFANKTESTMHSVTTKNTTKTFTTKTSNLLLEAAKTLDITNIKSDVEFLSLLFESVFNIIRDTKSEEGLFISDLTVIVPSIIEKCVQQLQFAFFKVFFGSLVNTTAGAADVGLKLATALETGKLNAVSKGIDTAEKIADSIASSVPSNGAADAVKNIVNGSLDKAKEAVDTAKTLETEGSNVLSGILHSFKLGK
ncbi:uncharacterized protein LOC116766182 isoform X2 [Danaus plexippus]|uniref:uncharacterized protein LOC116766182 isoform X2 n=1 Tax=Danaus plexippus TaxID=13037 RepID=UPI0013C49B28|nr:uncharacterized protein LOC116766182 isoform X2 [Danaus plexippus]